MFVAILSASSQAGAEGHGTKPQGRKGSALALRFPVTALPAVRWVLLIARIVNQRK